MSCAFPRGPRSGLCPALRRSWRSSTREKPTAMLLLPVSVLWPHSLPPPSSELLHTCCSLKTPFSNADTHLCRQNTRLPVIVLSKPRCALCFLSHILSGMDAIRNNNEIMLPTWDIQWSLFVQVNPRPLMKAASTGSNFSPDCHSCSASIQTNWHWNSVQLLIWKCSLWEDSYVSIWLVIGSDFIVCSEDCT